MKVKKIVLTKKELKKNHLDLEFKAESQKANIYLTLGTTSMLGFLADLILQQNYLFGSAMAFFIFVIAMIFFKKPKDI